MYLPCAGNTVALIYFFFSFAPSPVVETEFFRGQKHQPVLCRPAAIPFIVAPNAYSISSLTSPLRFRRNNST